MDKKDLQPERIFRVVKLRLLNGIHLLQSNRIMRTITIIYWLLFAAIMMFYQPAFLSIFNSCVYCIAFYVGNAERRHCNRT